MLVSKNAKSCFCNQRLATEIIPVNLTSGSLSEGLLEDDASFYDQVSFKNFHVFSNLQYLLSDKVRNNIR